jgi:3-mercaptopyruvate sulfurtransferase SseA
MRRFILPVAIAGVFYAVSCTTPASPPVIVDNKKPASAEHSDHTDDAPRITLADAKKDFDAGAAVFVDVRAEAAFKDEHIKGAVNITGGALDPKVSGIPKGKKIIVYCS